MNPYSGELEHADIFVRLDTAIETVREHFLATCPQLNVTVEVSYDEDRELEGVGFFDDDHQLVSCVTAYRLDRDAEVATDLRISEACLAGPEHMQDKLNQLFTLR